MNYFSFIEVLFAILLCYSSIVVTSGMSHPPLIVAPDPNANAVFLKKAELEPAATGTHASEGKHANHGDGKNYNSGKVDGEGYHKTSGYEENLGYQKKDKGNFGVQGTSGHSKGGGSNYGGGHHKANGGQVFKTLGGKSHAGASGDSFYDVHKDRDKKFKEFMAALQADNSFKSFSHGDQKSYGDSYDNVEGFHKGNKGSFSESDGYDVKEGHDNSGGEKFVEKGEYNDEYDHKEGNFGNAKYGKHKHKSGQHEGHKSAQGGKGGSSDKYNKKSGHGNLRGHNDHASHHDHHSSAHEGGQGTSHNTGNEHHGKYQGSHQHGKHLIEGHHGVGHHSAGHHGGKQGGHQHEANLATHHKSEHHAGSAAHHGAHHNGAHQASNVANNVPMIPIYYPYLTPPGTTATPHSLPTAVHSRKASEQKATVPTQGHIQTLPNSGVATSYLGVPASSIIVHEGGVIQHGTHLGLPLSPLVESAQDSQIQPILATVDDNIVSSSVVHASYEAGAEEANPESDYEIENEREEFPAEVNSEYNGEKAKESGPEGDRTSIHNGHSLSEKQEKESAKENIPMIKNLEHNHGSKPEYKGIEITSRAQEGFHAQNEKGSTSYEHNIEVNPSKAQDGSENLNKEERVIESDHESSQNPDSQNKDIPQGDETEMSPKNLRNEQKKVYTNADQDNMNEDVAAHGSNTELKGFKDVHSSIGRTGTLHHYKDQEDYASNEGKDSNLKDLQVSQTKDSSDYEKSSAKNKEGLLMVTEQNNDHKVDEAMKTQENDGKELGVNDETEAKGENQGNGISENEPHQEPHVSRPENFDPTIREVKVETKYANPSSEKTSKVESQIESSSFQNENSDVKKVEQETENEEASEASESMP